MLYDIEHRGSWSEIEWNIIADTMDLINKPVVPLQDNNGISNRNIMSTCTHRSWMHKAFLQNMWNILDMYHPESKLD